MSDKNSYLAPFPRRLRLLIDETRVSQQEIADFIGVTRQAVSQWKDGKTIPDCFSFKKIAEFFKVPLEYLYGNTESKIKENLALTESLGLSDGAIAKLQDWANPNKPQPRISLSEVLSRIMEETEFDTFLWGALAIIFEHTEHELLLHSVGDEPYYQNKGMQDYVKGTFDEQAREYGLRTIKAAELSAFHRYRTMEAMGKVLESVPDKYYTEHCEQLIEEKMASARAQGTEAGE